MTTEVSRAGVYRSLFVNSALVCATLAGTLSVLELGLRYVHGEPLIPTENLIVRKVGLLRVHTANQYDSLLGWVLKENMPYSGGMSTGQYGIRMNARETRPIPRGAVLTSGDSFTAGSEVENHQTWPAHLEKILGVPVLNAATGAWGSDQIILRVEQLLQKVSPRMVIVSFLVDDIERTNFRIYGGGNKPYFTVVGGKLLHHNNPVPVFSGRANELGLLRSVLGYSLLVNWTMERIGYANWWRDGAVYVKVGIDPVAVSSLLMKRLKEQLDRDGVRLIFILQYGGGQIATWNKEPDYAVELFRNFLAMGIECINTWPTLKRIRDEQGEDPLKRLYVMHDKNRLYGHMSDAGNRLVAELVAKQIGQFQRLENGTR